MVWLWAAAGGAVGSVGRFALSGWVTTWAHGGFPWGTFAVNAGGSAALGWLLSRPGIAGSARARAFVATGLCGGFTTFSTFDYEVLTLLRGGEWTTAAAYAAATVGVCVGGAALGMAAGQRWSRTSSPSASTR